jgi:formate dehydrogenase iron-sulfur subunit
MAVTTQDGHRGGLAGLRQAMGGGLRGALAGDADPASVSGYEDHPPRMGFFTDTSVCIGCKACEVACKEWNHIPEDGLKFTGMSYDNTVGLGADTWRHVAFIEQRKPLAMQDPGVSHEGIDVLALASEGSGTPPPEAGMTPTTPDGGDQLRWLMASDVCKHCTHAACLDVCPTGSLFRTEFGTVVVQEDICNGCGYCIPACPYGVIDQRHGDGRAWKCTLCYDRLSDGMEPACAKACTGPASPTPSCTAKARTTASAGTARSSCCWTTPRSTACHRTRWSPPATCRPCGGTPAPPPPR